MARLESDLKMGFFPTSISTLEKIFSKTTFDNTFGDKELRLLDPCCGEGDALAYIGSVLKAKTYGIEFDQERARKAFAKCDRFISGDALMAIKSKQSFEFLFLNPPYGDVQKFEGLTRLEKEFVVKYADCVSKNGYMLLVIGESSLLNKDRNELISELITRGYDVVSNFYDPDNSDYKNYKQHFILLKRSKQLVKKVTQEMIDSFFEIMNFSAAVDLNDLDSIDLDITKSGRKDIIFKGHQGYQVWQLEDIMKTNLGKLQGSIDSLINSHSAGLDSKCIDSPNSGQATILMMSGLLDKPVGCIYIKGQSTKIKVVIKDEKHEINRESYVGEIFGFDLETKKYVKFV